MLAYETCEFIGWFQVIEHTRLRWLPSRMTRHESSSDAAVRVRSGFGICDLIGFPVVSLVCTQNTYSYTYGVYRK